MFESVRLVVDLVWPDKKLLCIGNLTDKIQPKTSAFQVPIDDIAVETYVLHLDVSFPQKHFMHMNFTH